MPVRGEVKEAPKKEAVAKEVKETTPRKAPAKQEATPVKEVVKKSILEEKVKKYLGEVSKELPTKVFELFERMLTNKESGEKSTVVFLAFSTNGESDDEVDDKFNVEKIKELLFHYHTAPEKIASGKIIVIEVVPPTEADEPHLVCFQEI